MKSRLLFASLVTIAAATAHAEADQFAAAVGAVQLPSGFHQNCFTQPRPLEVVKASLVLEKSTFAQQGATRQQVLAAVMQSKYKALILGTNTAALCTYAIGQGQKNNLGRAPLGFCEIGLFIDDCNALERALPDLEKNGVRIDRVNKKLPQNIQKLAPGVGV